MGVHHLLLLLLIPLFFCISTTIPIVQSHEETNSRSVIDLNGAPNSVVWVVQLSDLHFSVFNPERALDFNRLIGPTLSMINPSLVFITGDLTDGKNKELSIMKQNEEEWKEYQYVIEDVVKSSGLDNKIFYDLRGNHDNFGVSVRDGPLDYFSKYSINGRLRRGIVHSVTLKSGGRKHLFVGFDSTMAVGPRGPTNLFGHLTDQLLAEIDTELKQWDSQSTEPVVKVSFGHFPLSFTATTDSGKALKDVFAKNSLSAYLCGHLHSRFGKNLKRKHRASQHSFSTEKYFQYNIDHQTSLGSNVDNKKCATGAAPVKEFWEWEMGDWRKSRIMRVLAIDSGHISFVDIDFKEEAKMTIILPTFPLDSRLLSTSYLHDYSCQSTDSLTYQTIRALIFSKSVFVSVVAKVYDTRFGGRDLVLDSTMKKIQENTTRGDLYTVPWNWRAFEDPSPNRFWLQIEATDIMGKSSISELRPFSINGVGLKLSWTWKEFLVMGCHWGALYYPILWSVLAFLFSILIISKALFSCSTNRFSYKAFSNNKGFTSGLLWLLTELSAVFPVWFGMLFYLIYLISFPWFIGQIFSEGENRGYMTYKGWALSSSSESDKEAYIGHPEIMVVVLPHLCFVVLPAILVTGALAAERAVYREHYMSLSGKKVDDYECTANVSNDNNRSQLSSSKRWVRKLLIIVCLAIFWMHWKNCRAMMKAYEMNPFLHFPLYCFSIPLLLINAVYKTPGI